MKKLVVIGVILLFLGSSIPALASPGNNLGQSQGLTTKATSRGYDINLNGTMGKNGWYVSKVTITITGLQGYEQVWYEFNNGSYIPYTSPALTVSFDGNYSFAARVIDQYGNVTQLGPVFFKIDKEQQNLEISYDLRINVVKFYATVQDNMSGMDRVEFWTTNGSVPPTLNYTQSFTIPYGQQVATWILNNPLPHKTIYVTVKAYDIAGNSGQQTIGINDLTFGLLSSQYQIQGSLCVQQDNQNQQYARIFPRQSQTEDHQVIIHTSPANGKYWNRIKYADYPVPLFVHFHFRWEAPLKLSVSITVVNDIIVQYKWLINGYAQYVGFPPMGPTDTMAIGLTYGVTPHSQSPTLGIKVYCADGFTASANVTAYREYL